MQKLNFFTFLLFSGFLVSSHNIFVMEKQCEKMEICDNEKEEKTERTETEDASDITEIDVSETAKETRAPVNFVYDENGDFYRDQLFPFITKQSSALALRQTCKRMNLGFCNASKIYKPIKLKFVFLGNIDEFFDWLKINNNIGFFVKMEISGRNSSFFEIFTEKIRAIFSLFTNKIKYLDITEIDDKNIDPEELEKSNITRIKVNFCQNLSEKFFGKLPKNLESLTIRNGLLHNDLLENLPQKIKTLRIIDANIDFNKKLAQSLPKSIEILEMKGSVDEESLNLLPKNLKELTLKCEELTGSCFKKLPKNTILKIESLMEVEKKYLDDLRDKSVKIYLKDVSGETLNNPAHKEKIKILRQKGIMVFDGEGNKYPDHRDEPVPGYNYLPENRINWFHGTGALDRL